MQSEHIPMPVFVCRDYNNGPADKTAETTRPPSTTLVCMRQVCVSVHTCSVVCQTSRRKSYIPLGTKQYNLMTGHLFYFEV